MVKQAANLKPYKSVNENLAKENEIPHYDTMFSVRALVKTSIKKITSTRYWSSMVAQY
jgi:hypothetical protein